MIVFCDCILRIFPEFYLNLESETVEDDRHVLVALANLDMANAFFNNTYIGFGSKYYDASEDKFYKLD